MIRHGHDGDRQGSGSSVLQADLGGCEQHIGRPSKDGASGAASGRCSYHRQFGKGSLGGFRVGMVPVSELGLPATRCGGHPMWIPGMRQERCEQRKAAAEHRCALCRKNTRDLLISNSIADSGVRLDRLRSLQDSDDRCLNAPRAGRRGSRAIPGAAGAWSAPPKASKRRAR